MATSKKSNIMSLAVEYEMQEHMKRVAKKRQISVSKLVRDLVEKHIPPGDDSNIEVDTVILKIPRELKQDSAKLKEWMDIRCAGIVRALST